MAELWFDVEAEAALGRLESDPGRSHLLAAVNHVLDQLESDPGDDSVRRHRFRDPPLWGVLMTGDAENWALLWQPHPDRPEQVVVQYLGPASFD
ncbi:MAG: hypothetical protein ACRD2W_05250 [Acidimicrobiales bacterium]